MAQNRTSENNSAPMPALSNDAKILLETFENFLVARKTPSIETLSPALKQSESLKKLLVLLMDLRKLSDSLGRGDLQNTVTGKGYVLSNLKALQSSLRHLTWQTKMVANGDFTQKVDFLGDFSASFNEMTHRLQNHDDQMQRLAACDALTQLPNRLSLEYFGQEAFESALKQNTALSTLMLDIDHFKVVNDRYGHAMGDLVLVKLGKLLSTQLRSSDFVARYGGEEFVVILPDTPLPIAIQIAERISAAVAKMVFHCLDDREVAITVSIGVSEIISSDTDYTHIVNRSDKAMYLAKISGRNKVCKA